MVHRGEEESEIIDKFVGEILTYNPYPLFLLYIDGLSKIPLSKQLKIKMIVKFSIIPGHIMRQN